MTREETLKNILDKSENNKIDLLTLYPIIDKACEEMQDIIYSKDKELLKIKKHDRLMRDKAHQFNTKIKQLEYEAKHLGGNKWPSTRKEQSLNQRLAIRW